MSVFDPNIVDETTSQMALYVHWKMEGEEKYGFINNIYTWLKANSRAYEDAVVERFPNPIPMDDLWLHFYTPTDLEKEYGQVHTQYLIVPHIRIFFYTEVVNTVQISPVNSIASTFTPVYTHQMKARDLASSTYLIHDDTANVDRIIELYPWMVLSGVHIWPDWLVDQKTWTFKPPFDKIEIVLDNCFWGGEYNDMVKSNATEKMGFDF